MADKAFGVKDFNLIGASGTPTIESPNNLNINAVNVAISTDITVAGKVSLGTGTSISSPGTNILTLGTNSVERVRIDSSGDVGIGTDNPTKILHLSQNSDVAIRMHAGNANVNARSWEIVVGGNASNNAEMVFRTRQDDGTGGSEIARFTTGGDLKFPSGGGIDFSATANSSGSMSSELLDDYEEGTWTPNFAFTGGSTGLTYSSRGGVYTRVGRLVTCYCMIVLSNKGSSTGNVLVSGLPYTATDLVGSTSIEGGGHAVYQDNTVGTHVGPIQAAVINNQSYFDMYRVTSTNPGHSDVVTNGNVANNSSYRFVLQYTAV